MPTTSRHRFLLRTAVALGAVSLAAACAAPAAVAPQVEPVRIATPAGTFDGVAAGPAGGREVVLLHGFPELGIAWDHQLRALGAAGYRAVAPDQRGYSPGVRPADVSDYRIDHAVGDVLAIADALGWDRFDVAGHDWGAVVAWTVAARHPDRVRSLTAVSVPHPSAFAEALRADPVQQQASGYMDFFRQPAPGPEDRILASGPPELPGVPAERSAAYFRRLSEPGALTAALNWYRANDLTADEGPVAVPTLFVASGADPMVAASGVAATREWVTGPYRLEVLDGVGHNVPEEAAAATTDLLLGHLAAVPVTG